MTMDNVKNILLTGAMEAIPMNRIKIVDSFWSKRQSLVRDVVIPYQWDALNDRVPGAAPSHTIKNFQIAAKVAEGEHYGAVFQDSDLAKWLETAGFTLSIERDAKLEKIADEVINLLERAQQSDGYLNSYYTIVKPEERWTDLRHDHELYCAGHFMEAAVAYYDATGKRKFIDIVSKLADYLLTVFGEGDGQLKGYPGHPEVELALVKLYRVTGNEQYLTLSKFFIDERGTKPNYFEIEAGRNGKRVIHKDLTYMQAHLPVREQKTAEGHAVRAIYLYCAMTDLALAYGDEALLRACRELWQNVVRKKMYITGGVGSSQFEERFTVDYDLPNDRAYTETCASVAMVFWAHRMLETEANGEYADVLEQALYNGVLSGISLDGKSYFYVNPLEVWPSAANHRNDMSSVKVTRQPWFGCACCPPNIARLIASLGEYVYGRSEEKREVYVHLYIGGTAEIKLNDSEIKLTQQANYPWDGLTAIKLELKKPMEFTMALRIPGWCRQATIIINGQQTAADLTKNGYAYISRSWQDGDIIELTLDMPIELVRAHPSLRNNAGKVAIKRGPLVYCLEETDNGANLQDLLLTSETKLNARFDADLLEGVVVITGDGFRSEFGEGDTELYTTDIYPKAPAPFKAIPYYAWSNRESGEMTVWIRKSEDL